MICHDLSCGLFARYRWLLVPAGIFLLGAWLCARTLSAAETEGTLGCILFYLLVGNAPSHLFAAGEMLSIPFLWLFLQIGCLLYTVEYPARDLGQYGLQVLIHCGCRKMWWYSETEEDNFVVVQLSVTNEGNEGDALYLEDFTLYGLNWWTSLSYEWTQAINQGMLHYACKIGETNTVYLVYEFPAEFAGANGMEQFLQEKVYINLTYVFGKMKVVQKVPKM